MLCSERTEWGSPNKASLPLTSAMSPRRMSRNRRVLIWLGNVLLLVSQTKEQWGDVGFDLAQSARSNRVDARQGCNCSDQGILSIMASW